MVYGGCIAKALAVPQTTVYTSVRGRRFAPRNRLRPAGFILPAACLGPGLANQVQEWLFFDIALACPGSASRPAGRILGKFARNPNRCSVPESSESREPFPNSQLPRIAKRSSSLGEPTRGGLGKPIAAYRSLTQLICPKMVGGMAVTTNREAIIPCRETCWQVLGTPPQSNQIRVNPTFGVDSFAPDSPAISGPFPVCSAETPGRKQLIFSRLRSRFGIIPLTYVTVYHIFGA
jgi:hypothetical protein